MIIDKMHLLILSVLVIGSFALDDNLKLVAINLFNEFSNKTRVNELVSSNFESDLLKRFPNSSVAHIYEQYTLNQIESLETELDEHVHFIYKPIRQEIKVAKVDFIKHCLTYQKEADLGRFEQNFLETGNKLVSLQKLVLRIINSGLETKLTSPRNDAPNKSWFSTVFNRLFNMFFGVQSPKSSSSSSLMNQMYILLQELGKIGNVQSVSNDPTMDKNLSGMKKLLNRLKRIDQLNKISSVRNRYLNTDNISPYNYEATLKLVETLGSQQQFNSKNSNNLISQLLPWMNFFGGGFLFSSLMGGTSQSSKSKYDPEKIQLLVKYLAEKDKAQQLQIEKNQLKESLNKLIDNQSKQQKQIDTLLQILANKNNNKPIKTSKPPKWYPTSKAWTKYPSMKKTTKYPAWYPPPEASSSTYMPPSSLPSNINKNANVLQQIKEQRKFLNQLLDELQKPFNGNKKPNQRPILSFNNTSAYVPSNQDITQAQQALLNVVKNITPIINTISQKGLIPLPKIEKSKMELLTILNSVNSRDIDDIDDNSRELNRVGLLCKKLSTVLENIIQDVEE